MSPHKQCMPSLQTCVRMADRNAYLMMSAYEQRTPRLLLRTTSATRPPRSNGITSVHLGHSKLSEPTVRTNLVHNAAAVANLKVPGCSPATAPEPGNSPYWHSLDQAEGPKKAHHIPLLFHKHGLYYTYSNHIM